MLETDRALYCKNNSYQDSPQPIGYGVTISAPHMHAAALQHLSSRLKPGCRALVRCGSCLIWMHLFELLNLIACSLQDVGHGTGYVAACMARMVGILQGKKSRSFSTDCRILVLLGKGKVVGIEIVKPLVPLSIEVSRPMFSAS